MYPTPTPIDRLGAKLNGAKFEELVFQRSPQPTVGVELELPILDRESGDLAPGAVRILKACAEESIDGTSAELMQSMLELKTGVCPNVAAVRDQITQMLRRVRNIASSMGFDLALLATHPFHRSGGSVVSPGERYDQISDRLGWLVHQRVVFGLHVHVGMPNGDMAIGVINMLVQHLPHLLALSANSPFWQGVDTGLASCRAALYRLLPHAGVPRYFARWKDFRSFMRVMRDCQAIRSPKDIYWDIRPRPEFGTIEFRICDMPPTLSATLAVVALIRTLVISVQRLLEERPQLRRGDMRRHWVAVENKWLATRYGLGATYIRTPGGKRRPLARDVDDLIERLLPVARESGDDAFLSALQPVNRFESGASLQQRLYRESGNWKELIDHFVTLLEHDLKVLPALTPRPVETSTPRAELPVILLPPSPPVAAPDGVS